MDPMYKCSDCGQEYVTFHSICWKCNSRKIIEMIDKEHQNISGLNSSVKNSTKKPFNERFFDFDHFIAPSYIKISFWLAFIVTIIWGFISILEGIYSSDLNSFFKGIIILILGPLSLRLTADYLMVNFKIYEQLKQIDQKLYNLNIKENSIPEVLQHSPSTETDKV